jgi:hypothetical protein
MGENEQTLQHFEQADQYFEQALQYFNDALTILDPNDDRLMARALCRRGAVYRLRGNRDEAQKDLSDCHQLNVRDEMPRAYHIFGCLLKDHNELELALSAFAHSEQYALETNNVRIRADSLVETVRIYYLQWIQGGRRDGSWPRKITQKAQEFDKVLEQGFDFSYHNGRIRFTLANLAYDKKEYEDALSLFIAAFLSLEKPTVGYGLPNFTNELESLENRIDRLGQSDPRLALSWCRELVQIWSDADRSERLRDEMISKMQILATELDWRLAQEQE